MYPKASEFFYDGEGEYTVNGTWPFVTYKLKLPQFILGDRYKHTYHLSGYATDGGDHLRLCFEMDEPFDYLSVNAHAMLTIVRFDGSEMFVINEPLNDLDRFADISEQEYRVMQANGYKRWHTYRGANREMRKAGCHTAMWIQQGQRIEFDWWENYDILISLSDVDQTLRNARVHVEIINGWK